MPLVPLYDQNSSNGSHHVRAPGGYETWRIIAYDAKQDLLLYAAVHEGFQNDPLYINAYRHYRRDPTRRAPPIPQDARYEELRVYHRGKCVAQSLRRFAAPPIPISGADQLYAGGCVLNFDPKPPHSSLDESIFNASHYWLFSNPLASLHGRLALRSTQFDFDGVPVCRDHRYGPALPKLERLIDGVAFFPDSAIFFVATPTASWMIRADLDGLRILDQPLTVVRNFDTRVRRIGGATDMPSLILKLGDSGTLEMDMAADRLVARSPHFFTPRSKESIHGFCEMSYPCRGRWREALFARRLEVSQPILTLPPLPPADKSSPSAPERARGPSSSPYSQNPERT